MTLTQERRLLEERGTLLDCEFAGTLSDAQATRLHQVEVLLDQMEDQNPVEQEADRRLAQTGDKLDEILTLLRSLPRQIAPPPILGEPEQDPLAPNNGGTREE